MILFSEVGGTMLVMVFIVLMVFLFVVDKFLNGISKKGGNRK